MFKRNEGLLDRIARVTLGMILLPVGLFLLFGLQATVLGLVISVLGGIGLVTGITGFCPTYILFGINTLEKEKELMARCMSKMSSFRQGSAESGNSVFSRICGQCFPSLGETHQQEE